MLVDSGAEVSLLKIDCIQDHHSIDQSRTITLGGACNGIINSMGVLHTFWQLQNENVKTEWQVVSGQNKIPEDGIIGRDNLWNRTNLDAMQKELKIFTMQGEFLESVPMLNPNVKSGVATSIAEKSKVIPMVETVKTINIDSCRSNLINDKRKSVPKLAKCYPTTLKARMKNLVSFEVPEEDGTEILINSRELGSGIYLGNSLSSVKKGFVHVLVANCNHELKHLNEQTVDYDFVKNYDLLPEFSMEDKQIYNISFMTTWDAQLKERADKIEKQLHLSPDLTEEEFNSIVELCARYQNLFHLEGDKLTHTSVLKHEIIIKKDQSPIHQKMYRHPPIIKEEINKNIQELLKNDIIKPSKSPWSSPLLVVPKKAGSDGQKRWRMVVDFRKLNEVTVKDAFPLPRIEDILDMLGNSEFYSTLDLASGYHQVLVDEKDRPKTAFSTPLGHFEFKRMPFGLTGAPATFQRIMNHILTGLHGVDWAHEEK